MSEKINPSIISISHIKKMMIKAAEEMGIEIKTCKKIHLNPTGELCGKVKISGIWHLFRGRKIIRGIDREIDRGKTEEYDDISTNPNGELAGWVTLRDG